MLIQENIATSRGGLNYSLILTESHTPKLLWDDVYVLCSTDGYQDIWAEQDVEPGPGHIVHIV